MCIRGYSRTFRSYSLNVLNIFALNAWYYGCCVWWACFGASCLFVIKICICMCSRSALAKIPVCLSVLCQWWSQNLVNIILILASLWAFCLCIYFTYTPYTQIHVSIALFSCTLYTAPDCAEHSNCRNFRVSVRCTAHTI